MIYNLHQRSFCNCNVIKRITSSPYYPSTNEMVENTVKTFKPCLIQFMKSNRSNTSISALISKYLFTYRNTPHWVMEEYPSTILYNRKIWIY